MLLAGDIGGTKTRLAIFSTEQGPRQPLAETVFASDAYPSLEAIVRVFLEQTHYTVERATFDVAGPVVNGKAKITNLPWVVDAMELERAFGLEAVHLLNDLEAVAYAVPFLQPEDLHTLNPGHAQKHGSMAVIAPGTGLGEGYLTWNGEHYDAHPSEGGHTDFAPTDALQMGLLAYLQERGDHVSYERVCSGLGIPNIYAYLRDSGYAPEPEWLLEELNDPTPVIMNAAVTGRAGCELCKATLDMFVAILGAETGNLALKILATGGVYIGGGIPPRIISSLEGGAFLRAFYAKGRFKELLAQMPVHVIMYPNAALLGAACDAFGL
jgi:glucokinase